MTTEDEQTMVEGSWEKAWDNFYTDFFTEKTRQLEKLLKNYE